MTDYVVSAGQTSSGVTLNGGDTETVLSGGTATGTVVNRGGVLSVASGGLASGSTVTGDIFVSSGGTARGLVVDSGGVEHESPTATVAGLQVLLGGSIVHVGFGSGNDTADIDPTTNVLTVTRSFGSASPLHPSYAETLAGDYANRYFHVTGLVSGDEQLTLNSAPCYCRGTLILTEIGERAVEALAIGDRVMTSDGLAPVRWIGRRSYSGRFARGNKAVLPIRVAAGALADGVPCRDLFVSPKHALLLDDVLIPAGALLNGVSIAQVTEVERVEYFHVELDRHAILVADGAPAESFVDDDGRGVFHNAHEHAERYPDARPTPAVYCAPRHEDGERVEAIRRRLARRVAPAAGHADYGPLRGSVDSCGDGRLYGWAQHEARPDVPVCLEVAVGDVVVARVLANRYRDDLRRGGVGDGHHAFEATLPVQDTRALRVYRVADGAALATPPLATPPLATPMGRAEARAA